MGAHSLSTDLQGGWSGPTAPLILMPSIVDPARPTLGAATVTGGIIRLLESEPLRARIQCAPVPAPSPRMRPVRQASSLIRSLVSRLPSKAEFTRSREFRGSLDQCLEKTHFDAVILSGSDLLWLIAELPPSLPTVVVAHNVEHRLFDSQIRSATWVPAPLRRLLERDRARLERYELDGYERARNVIFLCAEDAAQITRLLPGLNTLVQPPVFDYPTTATGVLEHPGARLKVGLVGNLGWWPNREGLGWFLTEVFPHVKDRIELHLFGEGTERASDPPDVTAHGFVSDPSRIWANCHFMISPIFTGAGVSVKVAEAIYNRVPVVATPFAVRGLPLPEDPSVVVLHHATEWIDFLRSAQGRALAGRRISAALAGVFHAPPYCRAIQKYLADLLR